MKLVSVNVGMPCDVSWQGQSAATAIFKQPVEGRVALRKLNLDGDRQADLSVHGGELQAVYCYALEHYGYWRKKLPGRELPAGVFGENFTTDGLLEDTVHLGDQFSIGSAQVVVTQPRLPCFKLGIRFHSSDIIKQFLASRRSGFYLGVTREGEVGAGDAIEFLSGDRDAVSVSDFLRLYLADTFGDNDVILVQRLLQLSTLSEGWKKHFRERLEQADV